MRMMMQKYNAKKFKAHEFDSRQLKKARKGDVQ